MCTGRCTDLVQFCVGTGRVFRLTQGVDTRNQRWGQGECVLMLMALVVLLLVLAIAGGIVVHPLLFLIAILAIVLLFSGRRTAL